MRLATLSTELEMWDCDLRHYVTVPAGTTVQVIEHSLKRWVRLDAPGGLVLTLPTIHAVRGSLDYLDEN